MLLGIILLIIIIIIFCSYLSLSMILYLIYQDNNSTIDVNKLQEYINQKLTEQEKTYLTNIEKKLNFSIINVALDPENKTNKNSKDITQLIDYINNDNTLTNEQKKEYNKHYIVSILFMRKSILDEYLNKLSSADKKILDKELESRNKFDQYIISENIIIGSMAHNELGINYKSMKPVDNILFNLGNQIKKYNIQMSIILIMIYKKDILKIID